MWSPWMTENLSVQFYFWYTLKFDNFNTPKIDIKVQITSVHLTKTEMIYLPLT